MQTCTRTCADLQSLNAATAARIVAILVLLLCAGVNAAEPAYLEHVSALDDNQDPGWQLTRALVQSDEQLNGLININSASVAELASALPGIGPGKAQRIVDWRSANGAFQFLEQLLEVSGIGPKTLERITPFIHLGDGSSALSSSSSLQRDPKHRWVLVDIIERANKDADQALGTMPGS